MNSTQPINPITNQEPTTHEPNRNAWVGGVILILLGAIFLLQNMGMHIWDNWWALFILIPAFGSLANAWKSYQSSGQQFTGAVTGSLIGGLVLLIVAVVFFFNLNWGMYWPGLLILAGIGALAKAFFDQRD